MNHLIIRTHWVGMPRNLSLDSMELISKELIPELRKVDAKPTFQYLLELILCCFWRTSIGVQHFHTFKKSLSRWGTGLLYTPKTCRLKKYSVSCKPSENSFGALKPFDVKNDGNGKFVSILARRPRHLQRNHFWTYKRQILNIPSHNAFIEAQFKPVSPRKPISQRM